MAVGRSPSTKLLNLDKVGIQTDPNSNKIIGNFNDHDEQTSVDNVYAIGDVLSHMPELQTVALKSGRMLAHRLKAKKDNKPFEHLKVDYEFIPTTIFSPIEYGVCGLSEEIAKKKYTPDNVFFSSRSSHIIQNLHL